MSRKERAFMRGTDFAFANDVKAAAELRTPQTSRMILFSTLALIVTALVWAYFAALDEVKRGNGKVVPTRQIQVVQSLEGGIVTTILVQEGATVRENEPLMRIDDTNFASQYGEIRERRGTTAARVARLEAQASEAPKLAFPDGLAQEAARAVETEKSLFEAQIRRLAQETDVLERQLAQRQQELAEFTASEKKLTETLQLLAREVALTRKLFDQRVVPEIEMLRLERQASEMRGQLEIVKASMGKSQAAMQEARSKIVSARTTFRAQAEDDLAKSRGDLAVLEENIKAAQDKVRRTELRSPVNGIVNKLNVTTVGAVVAPGGNVMEIVPVDDTLLVEGRIKPQDIAFIRADQDAVVKISAYDSSVYGSLKGKVERISADTIIDDKGDKNDRGETYYRVMVRTGKNHLGTSERPLPVIPGMVATVEVLTGQKTVLEYLLKPARTLRDEALRER
jgi:adhesin transport system membrane fusion protein